jgi:hypothetical protein
MRRSTDERPLCFGIGLPTSRPLDLAASGLPTNAKVSIDTFVQ